MSRALDQDVAESLMASDPKAAFNDIVAALNSNASELLEIEFLWKGYPLPQGCNVLLDGNSLGIPKTQLVQAFVVARQIFFNCLKDLNEETVQDIRDSTAVILLFDPEHITAANARKRIIQKLRTGPGHDFEAALKRELLVTDSFLTSRLHRHTKSPTLWGHRRWLLQLMKSMEMHHDIQHDLNTIVLVAAERHPRNYYAWLHMRWLVKSFPLGSDLLDGPEESDMSKLTAVVKDWCLRYPGDTSGWSFLLFCFLSVESSKGAPVETASSTCREVLALVESFQWTHESIWVFLRTLVATGVVDEDQLASFLRIIEANTAAHLDNPKTHGILRTAREWCIDYSVQSER